MPGFLDTRIYDHVLAGGLADELLEILNSDMETVDDWIMEKKLPLWDGQDCAICFCPIGRGDVGRRMRCSCWLHFECLGHGLGVKISERAVDDAQMSICPACNNDLGRVIPPGVVHRAVGDELFSRPLPSIEALRATNTLLTCHVSSIYCLLLIGSLSALRCLVMRCSAANVVHALAPTWGDSDILYF